MLTYGRDYLRSVAETRELETGSDTVALNGDTMLGWLDYQRGRVAVVFATLFAAPIRWKVHESESQVFHSIDEANRLYRNQMDVYLRLTDTRPDRFQLIRTRMQLETHLQLWRKKSAVEYRIDQMTDDEAAQGLPVGLVVLMEGAEGIRGPEELEEWFDKGLRLIGPAWVATRYSGGWREPGPLTTDGRQLLAAMAEFNFVLDVSHMDERAALEAIDTYGGLVVGTHGNCLSILPNYPTNRQFTDRVIRGLIERNGVIGLVPYNIFLKVGWTRDQSRRDEVHLSDLINHIDHVCQLAGDALHAGIGTDFDGGFGLQSTPFELNSIADLQILFDMLVDRGYSDADAVNILGGNWLNRLMSALR